MELHAPAVAHQGKNHGQMDWWSENGLADDHDYLSQPLLTSIGNKRALLGPMGAAVELLAPRLKKFDLAYLDPPYNQHPYGANCFMLNLLVHYQRPYQISGVSGIPVDWRRSGYNVRAKSLPLLTQLLNTLDAPFLLISFNNEGFISPDEMYALLNKMGSVEVFEIRYNAFRMAVISEIDPFM